MAQSYQQLALMFLDSASRSPRSIAFRYFDKKTNAWGQMTWSEYEQSVRKVAGWLIKQGLKKGDSVAILSANRPEWIIADLAILMIGGISIPIYSTSTSKDTNYILEHSESKAIFFDDASRVKDVKCPALKVCFDAGDLKAILASDVQPLAQVVAVKSEDNATIVYTSGTTGLPKGVVHTHGTIMAAIDVAKIILEEGKTEPDRFFSFLPLSHVAERLLIEFGSIAFADEVVFARSVDSIVEDLQLYPPTLLLCVPRLWERIYERITNGLKDASPVKRGVFKLAQLAGSARFDGDAIVKAYDRKKRAKVADKLVGGKLREKLGMHRVRYFFTGAAPIRPEIMRFFAAFGIFIREVYGLTENLCLGVYTSADKIVVGKAGKLFPLNEVKVADDGEILFRAPYIFKGYFKNDEATREALLPGGWFATGDFGEIDGNGNLKITGRKKELLKTSNGKYVAPVAIENELKKEPAIAEAMVVGDDQKYCIALVVINKEVITNEAAEGRLLEHLDAINKELARHESIKKIGVLTDGFTVENGMLTPTLKLKRKVVAAHYQPFIERIYSGNDVVVFE
jgi:long-chain acyl-CoA synthetase